MSLIKVEGLTFSYPSSFDNIFENVSFQIDTDWKLGFVGRNGKGKTTFLELLQGKHPFSGKIYSSVGFDYFPYRVTDAGAATIDAVREVCQNAEQWEILRELSLIGVEEEALWRPFGTLSEGERTKALLAAMFLNEGRFLLIDEPTNHLDAEARHTVAEYLGNKKGFILVSHDRRFLDGCVDHILALNRASIEVRRGNFSSWLEEFETRQASEEARDEQLHREISRLKQSSRRTSDWSDRVEKSKQGGGDRGYIGHKSAKMMKRSKSIEARQKKAIEEKSSLLKNAESVETLKMFPVEYHSETLAVFSDVSISYGSKTVCGPLTFDVKRGERIALSGKNGSGKSSVLKLAAGKNIEYNGKLAVGSGVVVSVVPQDTSGLMGGLKEYARENDVDESLFKTILRKLGFERVQFEKDMGDYSEGQKKKVYIARSLCESAHIYIWDEPLNYIDIYSRMQIERLIKEFSPTMLFVEHDAAFRESIATKIIDI